MSKFSIKLPAGFNSDECITFLSRNKNECLHSIQENKIYKAFRYKKEKAVVSIKTGKDRSIVEILNAQSSVEFKDQIKNFIVDWLGLNDDLRKFYTLAKNDKILKGICTDYKGLRLIGIPDLFESLVWSVIGQQINLGFAYTLKRRFTEKFGKAVKHEGIKYYLFPEPSVIAKLNTEDLRDLRMTSKKSEYIIEIAKQISDGRLSKELLLSYKDRDEIKKHLMAIRGVGDWTAEYVMMKCLRINNAFPIGDVGFHNAVKNILRLEAKPGYEELRKYAASWKGCEAYAVFYLWRSLIV